MSSVYIGELVKLTFCFTRNQSCHPRSTFLLTFRLGTYHCGNWKLLKLWNRLLTKPPLKNRRDWVTLSDPENWELNNRNYIKKWELELNFIRFWRIHCELNSDRSVSFSFDWDVFQSVELNFDWSFEISNEPGFYC